MSAGFNGISTNEQQSRGTGFVDNHQQHHDEELRLLASRRKLLSRNDWLALDSTRPLRIKFPAGDEKDAVGRRKKVKRSSAANATAAGPRPLAPLFDEGLRHKHPTYLMSGALPPTDDEHIEIRVGTSAFDTHSHPAKDSEALRAVSTGPQSTALSHLSEECMLLGADGDTFDANQVEVPAHVHEGQASSGKAVRSLSLPSDGPSTSHGGVENSLTVEQYHRFQDSGAQAELDHTDSITALESHVLQVMVDLSSGHHLSPRYGASVVPDERQTDDLLVSDGPRPAAHYQITAPADQKPFEDDTEYLWKQLMGIPANSEALTSDKDTGSWNQRVVASGITQEAATGDPHGDNGAGTTDFGPAVRMPQETDTAAAQNDDDLDAPLVTAMHELQSAGTRSLDRSQKDPLNDKDDEALWREFIIGSQDSGSEDELHLAWQRSRGKALYSSDPRSLELSGLGTSDKATNGEASLASPTLRTVQVTCSEGPVELEEDSIEDPPLESSPTGNRPRNIHTMSAKKLDPMRFKKPGEVDPTIVTRSSVQSNTVVQRCTRQSRKKGYVRR